MSLSDWERRGRLRRHETSAQEVADLLRLADEALGDARVEVISRDRRFCAAYDAARALADVALACAGYRTAGAGRHVTVFEALPLVLGEAYVDLGRYLNTCRAKRNVSEYERVGQIMLAEVEELIESALALREDVYAWLQAQHPDLLPPTEQGGTD
ncbi:MAG: hypothetical protein AB7Y46_19490 [Armatimonadota bacterium]|jgi:hypothetical protein